MCCLHAEGRRCMWTHHSRPACFLFSCFCSLVLRKHARKAVQVAEQVSSSAIVCVRVHPRLGSRPSCAMYGSRVNMPGIRCCRQTLCRPTHPLLLPNASICAGVDLADTHAHAHARARTHARTRARTHVRKLGVRLHRPNGLAILRHKLSSATRLCLESD